MARFYAVRDAEKQNVGFFDSTGRKLSNMIVNVTDEYYGTAPDAPAGTPPAWRTKVQAEIHLSNGHVQKLQADIASSEVYDPSLWVSKAFGKEAFYDNSDGGFIDAVKASSRNEVPVRDESVWNGPGGLRSLGRLLTRVPVRIVDTRKRDGLDQYLIRATANGSTTQEWFSHSDLATGKWATVMGVQVLDPVAATIAMRQHYRDTIAKELLRQSTKVNDLYKDE